MLRGKGRTVKEASEITGLSPKIITDCNRKFLETGIEELLIECRGGRRSQTITYEE